MSNTPVKKEGRYPDGFWEQRYGKAISDILKWKFATDGRKFNGNHKEVLKSIMDIAGNALCPTDDEIKKAIDKTTLNPLNK